MGAVRHATIDDATAIAAVHVRAWRTIYRGHMPDEFLDGLDVNDRADMWRRLVVEPSSALFVFADGDESVLGFCNLIPSRDADATDAIGEISAIYVDPDKWRLGIGVELLQAVFARARHSGFRELTLWVLDANQLARAFYEKAGFLPDGGTKDDQRWGGFSISELRYRVRVDQRSTK